MEKLTGTVIDPQHGGDLEQLIVLCHGRGAQGEAMLNAVRRFTDQLPSVVVAAPEAPLAMEGRDGREWFSMKDRDAQAIADGVRAASAQLSDYVSDLLKKHKPRNYMLFGFDQGGTVALHTALRHAVAPVGVVNFAGGMADAPSLARELKNKVPVLLGHGENDTVVPIAFSQAAEKALRAVGVPVYTVYEPDLGHRIGKAEMQAARKMMERCFRAAVA